ncbi:MAG: hypothetical protein OCC49_09850 [Fibrobacterales bacterium]
MLDSILHQLNPKRLFYIDSAGALLTAVLLGLVLVQFESLFGMPPMVLYGLALVAVAYSIYSLFCAVLLKGYQRPFLYGIAVANYFYCFLTLLLVLLYFSELSFYGVLYFVGEAGIIITMATLECKMASRSPI